MNKITKIPTQYESTLKIMNGQELSYLDEFIINHEPSNENKKSFRFDLLLLIKDIQNENQST